MFTKEIHSRLSEAKIVAVLVIDDASDAVPLAQALLRGGITAIELTLRTGAALDSLKQIVSEVPEVLAGVGTILTPEQAEQVSKAGAAFGVAPGLNRRVVEKAQDIGLPFAPGIMTPSEIELSLELGCRTMKFFPAESSGGLPHLQSMSAPYKHLDIDFIPLGGLNPQNAGTYLESPIVSAIGGSWIAKRDLIAAHDWNAIEASAHQATTLLENLNSN